MIDKKPIVSVVVTTYNRPDALSLILLALNEQDTNDFEVIVADDGSSSETKDAVELLKPKVSYKIRHVRQSHDGFRAAMIRNKSVSVADGEYLIFLDGDSVPQTSFISRHRKLAENNYFVSGTRAFLSSDFTDEILSNSLLVYRFGVCRWFYLFVQKKVNKFLPFLFFGEGFWRYLFKTKWQGVKTCNLGMWKKDFFLVNGFDESYYGWGYEDSDLIVRLIRSGVLRKEGRFALPVVHLCHVVNSRDRSEINYGKLKEVIDSCRIRAKLGIDKYILN